jgi:hypothetical protein
MGSLHGPLGHADHNSSDASSLLESQTEVASVDETENPRIVSEGFRARFLVAGVGFEPTTFGLWARRATAAPPRGVGVLLEREQIKPSTISTA